jgi:hypothetical protein
MLLWFDITYAAYLCERHDQQRDRVLARAEKCVHIKCTRHFPFSGLTCDE